MSERSRAVIFGDDAESYERHRPTYPPEAIDYINALVSWGEALEIGAGTGKATVDLVGPDRKVTCLEPSPEMARVLRAKDLAGVRVVESTFETFGTADDTFDLIVAAQAWHWVDRSTAYDRAYRVLRPGGALALMWNIPSDRYSEFEDVYARHAPHLLAEQDQRIKRRDSHEWGEDMAVAGFVEIDGLTHEWTVDLGPAEYRALYGTYSDHMMLPASTRQALLEELEVAVASRGSMALHYTTKVFSGKAAGG